MRLRSYKMNYPIRRLRPDELDAALDLALDTFLRFEAPDYGPEGVASFRRDMIDNPGFHENCRNGTNRIWGAFDGKKLVGIFAMRGEAHICLVFTHHAYHRRGIATGLFQRLVEDVRQEDPELTRLTLNSSPYGLPFYHQMGFRDSDVEKTINGIRFTPMEYLLL